MDHLDLKKSDSEIDLESGGVSEDDAGQCSDSSSRSPRKGFNRVWSELVGRGSADASTKGGKKSHSLGKLLSSDEILVKNNEDRWPEKFDDEVANFSDEKIALEKPQIPNSKRPPKPPRPPGGPSLDPADMKLVREISELAILKRKRTQQRKALLKLRKEKTSSKSSNLCALVVTALFIFVIIFQGLLGSRV